jgi:hypothetical protein
MAKEGNAAIAMPCLQMRGMENELYLSEKTEHRLYAWLEQIRTGKFAWLGVAVLVGVVVRAWGIGFGLPYLYHYDEHFYINTALKLGQGVLNNPPYAVVGLSNILFGEYGTFYVLGRLFHSFGSSADFEQAFRSDPTVFYMLGRLTTAALGASTILVVYFLGTSSFSVTAGLLAAFFLSTSFLHVRESHFAVPDVAMTFLVVLAVALAAVAMRNGKRRYILAASFVGGLAVAMKWTGMPVALAVGWAAMQMQTGIKKNALRDMLRLEVYCAAFFFLGVALAAPQVLINPAPYLGLVGYKYGVIRFGAFDVWQVDTLPGWLFYGKALWVGMGPLLLVAGVIGLIRRIVLVARSRDAMSIFLLIFPVTFFLAMGFPLFVYFTRYALPLVPFVALFAAEAFLVMAAWAGTRWGRLGWSLVFFLALASVIQPLAESARFDALLTRQDVRTLAKEWIEANIPAGAKIAVDWPTYGPPLSTPDKAIPYSQKVYDVVEIGGTGLSAQSLEWYREQGFDYLVASSFIYNIPLADEALNAERNAFYSALPQELVLVHEFKPYEGDEEPPFVFDEIYGPMASLWERERPGPTLKLYRLK